MNIAKDYPAYRFAVSDEESFATELKDVGLADSGLDVNIVVFGKDNRRYVMNPDDFDEFTEENFRKFMKKLNEGKKPIETLLSSLNFLTCNIFLNRSN